jgi:hypothetical protein
MYTLIKDSELNEYEDVDDLMNALYYYIFSVHEPEITEYSCSVKFHSEHGKTIYVTGLTGLEVKYLSLKYS